jgi:hypothetical protein
MSPMSRAADYTNQTYDIFFNLPPDLVDCKPAFPAPSFVAPAANRTRTNGLKPTAPASRT